MARTNVEKELVELEKRYWTAIKEKDAVVALQLTHDPCIVTGAQGVSALDRAAFARMMEAAPWTLEKFELDDVRVQLVRDDVAIVAYKVRESLRVDGRPLDLEAADSSTWVRNDGRWLCALHTEAIAGDPFGRH
jgi:uncharacterized protein (TIGR02246 family)